MHYRTHRRLASFASLVAAVLGGSIALTGCSGGVKQTATASSAETTGADDAVKMKAQKAVAGVGKEGQRFKDDTGVAKMMTGPLSALANVKQKVALEFQVKQAIDLYRASEGRLPKNHEEFMEKCITANRIQLPELPAGHVYRFNTEKGELWVYPEDEAPPAK